MSGRTWGVGLVVVLAVALLPSASAGAGGPASESGDPGPRIPVGQLDRTCDGVRIEPGDDAQRAIDAHPEGTTFCLAAGVHRRTTPLVPKTGDALVGVDQHPDEVGELGEANGFDAVDLHGRLRFSDR